MIRWMRRLLKRSFENPRTPLSDPAAWAVDLLGGGGSSSGVHVNSETVLTYPAVWRAVNLISRDVAKLPLFLLRRLPDGGKERARQHPLYKLLKFQSADFLHAYNWKFLMQAQALLWGNAYSIIERNGLSNGIVQLLPLDPARVEVEILNDATQAFRYKATLRDNSEIRLSPSDVFHLRGLGDRFTGMSVIAKARESLGLGMAASRFGGKFFANAARPSVVVQHPAVLKEEAARRLKRSIEQQSTGLSQAHRVLVLEEGATLNKWSMSNDDAQFLQTREFEIREVANWFSVPPHKLGDHSRTSFNSLEQENQSYLDDALEPWLSAWEAECWLKLLGPNMQDRDTHLIEFERNALLRVNLTDKGDFYSKALQAGWMSIDEVRERENMNPLPDGQGSVFRVPLNMGPAGGEEPPQEEPEEEPQVEEGDEERQVPEDQIARLLQEAINRCVVKLTTQAIRAARKPADFIDWIEVEMESKNRRILEGYVGPTCGVLGLDAGELLDTLLHRVSSDLLDACDALPDDLVDAVTNRTKKLEAYLASEVARNLLETRPWNAVSLRLRSDRTGQGQALAQ